MAQVAGRYTVSALSVEFGIDRRTVSRRLKRTAPVGKEGRSPVYLLVDAAPALLGVGADDESDDLKLDPVQQGARAKKYQADKLKIECDILKGNVFEAAVVEKGLSEMIANFRQRMIALPSVIAGRVAGLPLREIEIEARDIVYEALGELKEYDPEQYGAPVQPDIAPGSKKGRAAAGSNRKPVGRRKPRIK